MTYVTRKDHPLFSPSLPHALVALAAAAAAAGAAGCGEEIQDSYSVQIIGPVGVDYLAGARRVVLDVRGQEVASTTIMPGLPFSLTGTGVQVSMSTTGSLRVRALDENGAVVAVGQSPDVELRLEDRQLVVFIQKPGTFGRTVSMDVPRSRHVGVTAIAVPPSSSTGSQAASVTVGLFGMGRVSISDPMMMGARRERPDGRYYIYNPLIHEPEFMLDAATVGGVQARYDAASVMRPDLQSVVVFGGIGPRMMGGPEGPVAILEVFRMRRIDFDRFQLIRGEPRSSDLAGIARSASALGVATNVYAFGGRGDEGAPLDTVVALDPDSSTAAMTLLDRKMAAPRVGHTATGLVVRGQSEVLIVGGAAAQAPVAEIFQPSTGFSLPAGDPGPPRSDHAAVPLPDQSVVLIIGGTGADGAPLADIRRYVGDSHSIEAAPVTLATARSGCAAFVVGDDLVVAGGADAQGNPVGTAEVFSVSRNLERRETTAIHPRVRPTAAVLSNNSALLMGGEEMGGLSSAAVEIYQPNLPPR